MSQEQNLLTEFRLFEADNIRPSKSSDGILYMEGVLQVANEINNNGRIYPFPILKREVDKYQDFIKERRSLGELDHPTSSIISLEKVSHLVTKVRWDGNKVYGTLEVLDTPCGNIVAKLVNKHKIKPGISSRGLGNTIPDKEGRDIVQEDYMLVCWDLVSTPSVGTAVMSPLRESRDYRRFMKQFDSKIKWAQLEEIFDEILGLQEI